MSKLDQVIIKVRDLVKAYNPNQPRDPGGEGGGQWVSEGGGTLEPGQNPLGQSARSARLHEAWVKEQALKPKPASAVDHSADFTRDPSDGGWGDEKWGEQPKLKTPKARSAKAGGFTEIDLGSGDRNAERQFYDAVHSGAGVSRVKIRGGLQDIGGKTVSFVELSPSGKYSIVSSGGKRHSVSNSDIVAYRGYGT